MRAAAIFLFALLPAAADKWNVALLHDQDNSSLSLTGIEFPSDQRGIAVGVLTEKDRQTPVALVTSNGGKTWDQVRLREEAVAVTCFTDEICWYASPKNVWRSDEGGREWKKISGVKGILRMQFVSATHGWAAGAAKSAWETTDGGKNWTLLPVLKDVNASPANANFHAIAFNGVFGLIGGNSRAPRRTETPFPDWMVPEDAAKRREWPSMMILLETRDAGKTWNSSVNSVFGTVTSLHIRPEGGAAAVLEYFQSFEIPSEVLLVDFKSGRSQSVFRDKSTVITDLSLGPGDKIVIAGTAITALRSLPIPQKVKFLETTVSSASTSTLWTSMDVDYRATARRVHLARQPNGQLWAATDTGIILRLDRAAPKAP